MQTAIHPGLSLAATLWLLLISIPASAITQSGKPAPATDPTTVVIDEADVRKAIEALDARIERSPGSARLFLERGNLYLVLGENARAAADYTSALALDDELDEAYFQRGIVLGRDSQYAASIADLTTFIERNPEHSLAYTKRGVRHLWNGNLDSAYSDYRRALKLDEDNAEAADDIGVIYAQRGEMLKALASFTHAINADPTYQKAYHNRALVLYLLEKPEDALRDIYRAEGLQPDNRNTLLLKSAILDALGRHDEANDAARRAAGLPDNAGSQTFPLPPAPEDGG